MIEPVYLGIIAILLGILLDTLLGDPHWLPHPIRLFGKMIATCEQFLNKGKSAKTKGTIMGLVLVALVGSFFWGVQQMICSHPILFCTFNAIFFFYGISNRSLIEESLKVESKIEQGDIVGARHQLAYIVGRDTEQLTFSQIRKAVLETLSENLSDGVIAPLLYYALGGVPLMMVYKMINTLDSMVGYKNERFINFGYFSAKLDDVANFIPARLTALTMALFPPNFRALKFIFQYGHKHASPNSGYPESALAGLLNCRLGGPTTYGGKVVDKPYIGNNGREVNHEDVKKACIVNIRVTAICLVYIISLLLIL